MIIKLQFFKCHRKQNLLQQIGNCITGNVERVLWNVERVLWNVERVLWNVEVTLLILRRFSAQERNTDSAVL
jgi:hypothetical protein